MRSKFATVTFFALILGGCVSTQSGSSVNVGYYNVKGTSFEELDREIALHGPRVQGVGKAIASTRVRMAPDVRYSKNGNECRVTRAKVSVIADVTLPRLSDRERVDGKLREAFSNIEEYAKLHEAVHVRIAEEHARMAEKEILAVKAHPDCKVIESRVTRAFNSVMQRHEKEQLAFDAQEKRRFASN